MPPQSDREKSLEQLYERATIHTSRTSHSPDVREEIDEHWEAIHSGLDPMQPENFGPYLSQFLTDRHQETDAKNRRSRLCGCGNPMCNVLNGGIPEALKTPRGRFRETAITPSKARSFVHNHRRCHAVQAALSQWDEERSRVRQNLLKIIQTASRTDDSPPINEDSIPS